MILLPTVIACDGLCCFQLEHWVLGKQKKLGGVSLMLRCFARSRVYFPTATSQLLLVAAGVFILIDAVILQRHLGIAAYSWQLPDPLLSLWLKPLWLLGFRGILGVFGDDCFQYMSFSSVQ
jgi:hypothetical protein